jgi:hypothetical protein
LVNKNAATTAGESYPFHPVLTTTIFAAAAKKKGEGLTHGDKSAKKQSSERGTEVMTEFKKINIRIQRGFCAFFAGSFPLQPRPIISFVNVA